MRMEFLHGDVKTRQIGAAVVRADVNGTLLVEFGPADGLAFARLRLSPGEASQLAAALKSVSNGRDEEIILVENENH